MENIGQIDHFCGRRDAAPSTGCGIFSKTARQRYQDIQPEFMQQLGASWKKWEARPELNALLDQNFLCYDGTGRSAQPDSQLPLHAVQRSAQPAQGRRQFRPRPRTAGMSLTRRRTWTWKRSATSGCWRSSGIFAPRPTLPARPADNRTSRCPADHPAPPRTRRQEAQGTPHRSRPPGLQGMLRSQGLQHHPRRRRTTCRTTSSKKTNNSR